MATARPTVNVYSVVESDKVLKSVPMPDVFLSPIRPEQVSFVHNLLLLNTRQPYAVSKNSGYQTSAESWGTGRAVARIPRVKGGGTHRSGQGAFGNMCRGGGMFAPTKIWRKWHHKLPLKIRRQAVCSALAASAVTSIVMARGHKVDNVPELPLVVNNRLETCYRRAEAEKIFKRLGITEDLKRVQSLRRHRSTKGKWRSRPRIVSRGPLIVYGEERGVKRGFEGIPGVDTCSVSRLALSKLAPGGQLGRLIVFTESAMVKLAEMYKTFGVEGVKKNFVLPRPIMANTDLARIINSNEIQTALRPKRTGTPKRVSKVNPMTDSALMLKLNPAHQKMLEYRKAEEARVQKSIKKTA